MKKRVSKYLQEYRKQRKRILDFIRQATKRGYEFEPIDLPKPSSLSAEELAKYTKKLKKIKPIDLYEKSKYKSQTGEAITGSERRHQENKERSRKALETRRKRIRDAEQNEPSFDRTEQDKIDKQKAEYEEWLRQEEIYDNYFRTVIDELKIGHEKAAAWFERLLNKEISTYGKNKIYASMTQYAIEEIADTSIYAFYDLQRGAGTTYLSKLYTIILGEIPSSSEMKEFQDMAESEDFDEDYGV